MGGCRQEGEHPSLSFQVGVTRKVFFQPAGDESPSMILGGTVRIPWQARTNVWQAAEVPHMPGGIRGAATKGGASGARDPISILAVSGWILAVLSGPTALLFPCPHSEDSQ